MGPRGARAALSSGTWRRGLGDAERGGPAPVFTCSVAGPVCTPARQLFTSLRGAASASRYRWGDGGRQARRALGWESGIPSSDPRLAHTSCVAFSSASLGLDPLSEGGSLERVDTQGPPSPDISQALDIQLLPPRGQLDKAAEETGRPLPRVVGRLKDGEDPGPTVAVFTCGDRWEAPAGPAEERSTTDRKRTDRTMNGNPRCSSLKAGQTISVGQ